MGRMKETLQEQEDVIEFDSQSLADLLGKIAANADEIVSKAHKLIEKLEK